MEGEECNTNLALGIGGRCGDQKPLTSSNSHGSRHIKKPPVQLHVLFPKKEKEALSTDQEQHSNIKGGCLSRSRSRSTDDEEEEDKEAAGAGRLHGGKRKKLKLSKEQMTLLEDSFREQNILNQMQKQKLADKLHIQPRQVEVWFQNRRARTKLKQTEVDCEYLKKRCDSLNSENRRLKRELQILEAMVAGRPGSPLYMHLLKATELTTCPSCERIAAAGAGRTGKTAGGGIKDQLLSVNSRILSL